MSKRMGEKYREETCLPKKVDGSREEGKSQFLFCRQRVYKSKVFFIAFTSIKSHTHSFFKFQIPLSDGKCVWINNSSELSFLAFSSFSFLSLINDGNSNMYHTYASEEYTNIHNSFVYTKIIRMRVVMEEKKEEEEKSTKIKMMRLLLVIKSSFLLNSLSLFVSISFELK